MERTLRQYHETCVFRSVVAAAASAACVLCFCRRFVATDVARWTFCVYLMSKFYICEPMATHQIYSEICIKVKRKPVDELRQIARWCMRQWHTLFRYVALWWFNAYWVCARIHQLPFDIFALCAVASHLKTGGIIVYRINNNHFIIFNKPRWHWYRFYVMLLGFFFKT